MKTQSQKLIAAAFVLAALVSGSVASAHEGHKHGGWNSAAAKVCKGQSDEADKKACFKQLREQRKAAMEAFDKGFTYTPAAAAPSAAPSTN